MFLVRKIQPGIANKSIRFLMEYMIHVNVNMYLEIEINPSFPFTNNNLLYHDDVS